MPALVKMGVIGLGRMGQLNTNLLSSQINGAKLYAVAEINEQARSRVAGEFDITRAFADFQELLALPELDAVIITTPTSTHHDLVVAAAEAGKAILCEKPLALTLAETRSVQSAATRSARGLNTQTRRRAAA